MFFCSVLNGAIILEDNFNDSKNWSLITQGGDVSNSNGTMIVSSTNNSAILLNDNEVSDLTYTVRMKIEQSEDGFHGVTFGFQKGSVTGYTFLISRDKYTILSYWENGAETTLHKGFFSFIDPKNNEIRIIKRGQFITIAINGKLMKTVSHNKQLSGRVGLLVEPTEKIAFDHALLTDDANNTVPPWYFHSDFKSLYGWEQLGGDGSVSVNNGVLVLSQSTGSDFNFFTSGRYSQEPCTTIVRFAGGDSTSAYGIEYRNVADVNTPVMYFLINGNRQYGASVNGNVVFKDKSLAIHGKDGIADTIIITKDYVFKVNGVTLIDTIKNSGIEFTDIGIRSGTNSTVEFHDFRGGTYTKTSIADKKDTFKKIATQYPVHLLGGVGVIYDIRGRQVASLQRNSTIHRSIEGLSAGSYFIYLKNKKDGKLKRKTIVKLK